MVKAMPIYLKLFVGDVCPFGPVILWNITRTLCLHGGVSYLISDKEETF